MPKGSKGRRRSRTSSSGAASSPTSNSSNASQGLFRQEPNEWLNSQSADAFGQNTDPSLIALEMMTVLAIRLSSEMAKMMAATGLIRIGRHFD